MKNYYQSMYDNVQGIVGISVLEPVLKNDSEKNNEAHGSSTMTKEKKQY